jgi:hypothetical protein
MDYETACESTVSRCEAIREIEAHNADWSEFVADHGDRLSYSGRCVLSWLGY